MPELPEVETLRRSLAQNLPGHRIEKVYVRGQRLRYPVNKIRIIHDLKGRVIEGIRRRAKYLIIHLKGGKNLILHLGMSGRLLRVPKDQPLNKHEHLAFTLDDGFQVRFRDHRRFGMVDTLNDDELNKTKYFRNLGVEPLSSTCNARYFFQRSRGLKKPIKHFLMDSQKIVGIGNIYANESLYLAGLHPQKPVGQLTLASWEKLLKAVKKVLRQAIRQGGTTLKDFFDSNGDAGYFQVSLRVYQRQGEPCPRCQKTIKKMVLSNRSTFYCPHCQKK